MVAILLYMLGLAVSQRIITNGQYLKFYVGFCQNIKQSCPEIIYTLI